MATTKVTTDVIDMSGNAGGLTWVTGTTVQQPSGVIGEIREDTDTNRTLVYTDETGTAQWRNLKEAAVSTNFSVDYLIVAGGGGGGGDYGGGGGAGGLKTSLGSTSISLDISIGYTATVGPGGSASTSVIGGDGLSSAISGTGITTITCDGGGGGGTEASSTGRAGGLSLIHI